jgi:photosystem II stability/assembly factor-like uncharacterized protein
MKFRSRLAVIVFCLVSPVLLPSAVRTESQNGWIVTRIGASTNDLNTVYFLDGKRGWIGGDDGLLCRTDDGGRTWVRQAVGTSDAINDIYFRDKENGFLLAGHSIFMTEDSGIRWTESRKFLPDEFDGANVELYSVRFPSKKKGWVVGSVSRAERVVDSILVSTDDAGGTWQRQRAPSHQELIHIDFVNDKRGWIVGAGGTVINTQDGGTSWASQSSGVTTTIFHIDFKDEKRGWAVGERGTILRTTDSGQSWLRVTAPVRSTLLSVRFVNEDDGWIVGRSGTILRTEDGGQTWLQQESSTKQNLYSLHFNKKIGWAVGGDGVVLSYER